MLHNFKHEIKQLLRPTCVIESCYINEIKHFLPEICPFRMVSKTDFLNELKTQIKDNFLSIQCIYAALNTQNFEDFAYKISIGIAEEPSLKSYNFNIIITEQIKNCLTSLRSPENKDNDLLRIEISNFLYSKFDEIFRSEMLRIEIMKDELLEKFELVKKPPKNEIKKLADLFFLLRNYDEAKKMYIKCDDYEFEFYCDVFLDNISEKEYDPYSKNPIIQMRRTYFLFKYGIMLENNVNFIYSLLSGFNHPIGLAKGIFELELAAFLLENNQRKKRIAFSLFLCINYLFDEKMFDYCLDCIANFKNHTRNRIALEYVQKLKDIIETEIQNVSEKE
ncbi:hypothetical protein EDEG_02612 [Edhazardia aedis USNM 41457]|uniref:Uncharacterized protein n=1 Tax=Edhazardia aedis (strain USNM 41457) TaxID=1003232 RepID=J8ZTF8_EDHAE|nr:hypothetical protein EDEG_02612 [Edhazardia aedis USNM 41457]|eukprot:EJW02968.1 hypothetical protein EDEG_02612 [Edhazardia aedis USNM 41457]